MNSESQDCSYKGCWGLIMLQDLLQELEVRSKVTFNSSDPADLDYRDRPSGLRNLSGVRQ